MTTKNHWLALTLALSATAFGGSSSPSTPEDGAGMPEAFVPAFDALIASYEFQNGLEFDDSDTELDASRYSAW